jgi:hypothetical protein
VKAVEARGPQEPVPEDAGHPRYGHPAPSRRSLRVLSVALVTVSLAILAIWGALAAVHADDRYRIDQVSGVHMALAWHANHGTLYPPLFDGQTYGGTRYMPLPIVLDAAAARLTGDYLTGGKLLSYLSFLGLIGLLAFLLRRLRCPWPLAIGLAAMVLVTETGLAASMDARSDALPVLLQLGAVGLILHGERPAATVGAAALGSLAFLAKVTSVWAPIAIVLWLVIHNRKRMIQFVVAYVAFSGATLALFGAISHGRLFENVFGLSGAGISGIGPLIRAPYRFFHEAIPQAMGGWVLVPLVVAAAWWAVRERKPSIWALSLGSYLVILMVMLADRGVGWNQLIDLVVLAALVVGEGLGRVSENPRLRPMAVGLLAVTILWVNITGLAFLFGPDIQKSRDPAYRETASARPLAGLVTAGTRILAEDPYVPVSLDRAPVVLDPFMLITIGQRDPSAVQDLVRRIEDRQFDLVVLRVRVDDPSMASWFVEEAFGSNVADALRANYVYDTWRAGYYLYKPGSVPAS